MATARERGVTLLELLVGLVVGATLAALALPSYRQQLLRAYRFEAMEALLAASTAQERFHLGHGRYAAWLGDDASAPPGEPALPLASTSRGGRYRLELAEAGATGFRALARPVAGRGQDADAACAVFEIAASGRRSARDAAGRDATRECWR